MRRSIYLGQGYDTSIGMCYSRIRLDDGREVRAYDEEILRQIFERDMPKRSVPEASSGRLYAKRKAGTRPKTA